MIFFQGGGNGNLVRAAFRITVGNRVAEQFLDNQQQCPANGVRQVGTRGEGLHRGIDSRQVRQVVSNCYCFHMCH